MACSLVKVGAMYWIEVRSTYNEENKAWVACYGIERAISHISYETASHPVEF